MGNAAMNDVIIVITSVAINLYMADAPHSA